jgi:hypothetical protein
MRATGAESSRRARPKPVTPRRARLEPKRRDFGPLAHARGSGPRVAGRESGLR